MGTATGFGGVIIGLKSSMVRFWNPVVVPPSNPRGFVWGEKHRRRLSFICIEYICVDDLMKPNGSIRVVGKWCGKQTNPSSGV
jgi:hypothetical protein